MRSEVQIDGQIGIDGIAADPGAAPPPVEAPTARLPRTCRRLNGASDRATGVPWSLFLFAQDGARLQLFQQRPGLLQVGGAEAFGEADVRSPRASRAPRRGGRCGRAAARG